MNICGVALCAAAISAVCATPAKAEEAEFGYSYGAETLEAGESELALWVTDRRGKGVGHYAAQDFQIELEHGVTDRLQVSAYAKFASHHIRGLEPAFDKVDRDLGFQGLQAAVEYAVLNPDKDGVGLAFYVEPSWSRINKRTGERGREYELELKTIVQKNFFDERLVWVANLTLEPEWEREQEIDPLSGEVDKAWEKELAIEVTSGASYRLAPRWALGIEGRYHSVYPDWTHGLHRDSYAVSAGPTVHYSGGKWGVTATYLPQLFGSGGSRRSSLSLDEHEKREVRVKLDYEL